MVEVRRAPPKDRLVGLYMAGGNRAERRLASIAFRYSAHRNWPTSAHKRPEELPTKSPDVLQVAFPSRVLCTTPGHWYTVNVV